MTSLTDIKRFVEGTDLIAELQKDVEEIKGSDVTSIMQGFSDLQNDVKNVSEYSDLFADPYSNIKSNIQKVTNDAQTFIQGIDLQVQRPNWYPGESDPSGQPYSQYIDLLPGTAYVENGWVQDNVYSYDTSANLWDAMQNPSQQFVNYWGEAYSDGGLGCDWANSGSLQFFTGSAGSGGGNYTSAQGSLAQWAPYIHLGFTGDPSALDADVFIAG